MLARLRETDSELSDEVESLLESDHVAANLEESPTSLRVSGTDTRPIDPAPDQTVPDRAGRFAIRGEIARGGMGAIYRADDPDFQRPIAVKVLLARMRFHGDAERRFLLEARITGRLQHPGVPPIHEIGRLADGSPYFAMKLVEGLTLAHMLAAAEFAAGGGAAVGVFEPICQTVAYAHRQGIIHRDLKPSNVMVGAFGEVQVMDWGIARELRTPDAGTGNDGSAPPAPRSELTNTGDIRGTPAYMAPEQARGETALDERCDVFGLPGLANALARLHWIDRLIGAAVAVALAGLGIGLLLGLSHRVGSLELGTRFHGSRVHRETTTRLEPRLAQLPEWPKAALRPAVEWLKKAGEKPMVPPSTSPATTAGTQPPHQPKDSEKK